MSDESSQPLNHPADGSPLRAGEELWAQHRTLGASDANVRRARELRKEMSLPEVLLWRELKGKLLGIKFRKQFPLLGYVIDFACVEVRLLIEIDGIVYDMGDRPERDVARDALFARDGWRTERIPAADVLKNPTAVAAAIVALADSLRPLRPFGAPPRSGEDLEH